MVVELTLSDAIAFNLERHHLSERAPFETAIEVVGDIMGLNAQGALNFQISLWNRVEKLNPDFLPKALFRDRTLVRSWLMRNTVHIIPSERLPICRGALVESLMREWNRWTIKTGLKESPSSWEPHYSKILDLLEDGPLSLNQMIEALSWRGQDGKRKLSRIVREMSLKGILCHAEPSGYWHNETEHTFARLDNWLPKQKSIEPKKAREELLRGYLRAFGPASPQDFAYWTGKRVRDCKPVFESLSSSLESVLLKGQRGTLYALKDDILYTELAEEVPVVTRLLPAFDAIIMGHRDKGRLIDPKDRKKIFLPYGDVSATIVLDGRVQGVWNIRKIGDRRSLKINPFRKLSEHEIDGIEDEVERLRNFTEFEIEILWSEP
ncbi:MAG: winged helix DNA-binding domain-containing protein [Candidatus Bathyarchaeota archaeon]|jgi:hypothetical protein